MECHHSNDDFAGNSVTVNYAYYKKGSLFMNGLSNAKAYGEGFGEGDVITMCYNPFKRILTFYKNDVNQGDIEDIESRKDLSYRLCIYLGWKGSVSLQLLE